MKLKLCFLLLLCFFFRAGAQEKTIIVQGLKIGDKVPDVLITGLSNYKVNGQAVSELRLSHFYGKLVILDFWATWCAPCRAMVPVMDSLQKTFAGKIQFLPVSYEPENVIAPVLAQLQKIHPFNLPEVTHDKTLHALFAHRSLPHYVWIDQSGIVRAITEEKAVTAANIRAMLTGGHTGLPEKTDLKVRYDGMQPLLLNGNGGDGSSLRYHSVLTGYIPGLSGGMRISAFDPVAGQLFTVRNGSFAALCRLAFADGGRWITDARYRILSKDSSRIRSKFSGQEYRDWQAAGNGWCYELLAPPQLATNAFPMIREDLKRMFPQYNVALEPQKTKCLALVRSTTNDKLKSAGGDKVIKITPYSATLRNVTLSVLMQRLQVQYLQTSTLPVVDETGYAGHIDMDLDAKLYDVSSLNSALAKYDLAFVERESTVEILVIRDAAIPPPTKK